MKFIDTHAHIDQLADLPGAMGRAHEAGVSAVVAMSVDLESMHKVLEIQAQYQRPRIYAALGVHPGMVKPQEQAQAFEFMRGHLAQAVAVGETGLDYWYKWVRKDDVERQKQKDSFAYHLQLAKEHQLPIVIHSRGAWQDCLQMTLDSGVAAALFHWYSGPLDVLDQILAAGFYVSTSLSVAYSPESQKAMAQAPLQRILVETDSPVRYRDGEAAFSAEPKDVLKTVEALAKLKNLGFQEVLNQVNANAMDFFGLKDEQ